MCKDEIIAKIIVYGFGLAVVGFGVILPTYEIFKLFLLKFGGAE